MQAHLTRRELSSILAALRFYQAQGQCEPAQRSQWMLDIASDLGKVRPLDAQEIDWLCEKLNVFREDAP